MKTIKTIAFTCAALLLAASSQVFSAPLMQAPPKALDSARLGLTSMEHWYGLPEALFEEQRIQDYPAHYNYNNEQHRFEEAGRLWKQAAEPG